MESGSAASAVGAALIELVENFAQIDDILDRTWLEVTGRLLKFCRAHQPGPAAWELLGGEPEVTIEAVDMAVRAELLAAAGAGQHHFEHGDANFDADGEGAAVSSFASDDDVAALVASVVWELARSAESWDAQGGSEVLHAVAVARGAANAIDSLYGETFIESYRNEGEVYILPGEPFPVLPRDPRSWIGEGGPNTNPSRLPSRDLAWTTHLRIGPEGESAYRCALDFEFWNLLGGVEDPDKLRLAVGQPNLTLGEFDIVVDDEARLYFNRGPADPGLQARRVLAQIEAAGEAGVDVLLLPEYALNETARHLVEVGLDDIETRPRAVVAGLCEPTGEGEYLYDEAWLCVPGPFPTRPTSVTLPRKTSNAPIDGQAEGIMTGSEVRFLVTRQWTIAVLICRDALAPELLQRVASVSANLVLVPAMSPRTASMVTLVGGLRAQSQAFIAFANGPAHWIPSDEAVPQTRGGKTDPKRVEGVLGGPYGDALADWVWLPAGAGGIVADDADGIEDPKSSDRGLWVYEVSTRSVVWRDTTAAG